MGQGRRSLGMITVTRVVGTILSKPTYLTQALPADAEAVMDKVQRNTWGEPNNARVCGTKDELFCATTRLRVGINPC